MAALSSYGPISWGGEDNSPRSVITEGTPYQSVGSSLQQGREKFGEAVKRLQQRRSDVGQAYFARIKDLMSQDVLNRGLSVMGFDSQYLKSVKKSLMEDNKPRLWVLVSTSMPPNMIRQYVEDAAVMDAVVLFRGIPDDMTFGQFVRKHILPMRKRHNGKEGAKGLVGIDPRAFDLWRVEVAPTIVWGNPPVCEKTYIDKHKGYQRCSPASPDSYCKIAGSVTLKYADRVFRENGCKN